MNPEDFVEMFVAGLVLDPTTNAPIVILKDAGGGVCLPIWIGLAEATAIASAVKSVAVARPMTHDLLKNIIEELGGEVTRVVITDLRENTFISTVEVRVGDVYREIDARPSDSIALAVRFGAQILVSQAVLTQAQVTLVSLNDTEQTREFETPPESEGERTDEPVDFTNVEKTRWSELLAEMDPEDFKYKM